MSEQVWDDSDRPGKRLFHGRPTGAATPLMWAHGEYIKLLRSTRDGEVFDVIPEVAQRYRAVRATNPVEIWKHNRQVRRVSRGSTLRVVGQETFRLRWSDDEWRTVRDTDAAVTSFGVAFVDVSVQMQQQAPIRFTFCWSGNSRWEGRDYEVGVQ